VQQKAFGGRAVPGPAGGANSAPQTPRLDLGEREGRERTGGKETENEREGKGWEGRGKGKGKRKGKGMDGKGKGKEGNEREKGRERGGGKRKGKGRQ